MAATIETGGLTLAVKLRNLSAQGALVEGDSLPAVGAELLFRKSELAVSGHVAWVTGRRAGIAFDEKLEPEAVLRHLPSPRPKAQLDFRRPPLRTRDLSPGERKVAEDWIWGNPLPSGND